MPRAADRPIAPERSEALQRGARPKWRYYMHHYYHLISQCIIVLQAFCVRFSPMRGVNLIPNAICRSRSCRRILSRLRADLRENPTKQWASRDALTQSAGSISNSTLCHSDVNIAIGPILKNLHYWANTHFHRHHKWRLFYRKWPTEWIKWKISYERCQAADHIL